jgi:hypothetical protein
MKQHDRSSHSTPPQDIHLTPFVHYLGPKSRQLLIDKVIHKKTRAYAAGSTLSKWPLEQHQSSVGLCLVNIPVATPKTSPATRAHRRKAAANTPTSINQVEAFFFFKNICLLRFLFENPRPEGGNMDGGRGKDGGRNHQVPGAGAPYGGGILIEITRLMTPMTTG